MRHLRLHRLLLESSLIAFVQCTGPAILVSHPPTSGPDGRQSVDRYPVAPAPVREPARADSLDFALALGDTGPAAEVRHPPAPASDSVRATVVPLRYLPLDVRSQTVRVGLRTGVGRATLYSVGAVRVLDGRRSAAPVLRGRCSISAAVAGSGVSVSTAGGPDLQFALPCTLKSESSYNVMDVDTGSFRGDMVLAAAGERIFHVVNALPVEEYLRGVVPLELGRRGEQEVEALKAQAVAARTYTYRKMEESRAEPYDVLPTVADQIYGGVNAEHRQSDIAIRATENLVIAFGDSLVYAYYHSTCGGKTANVQDAWDKPPRPYLVSCSDVDKEGRRFCAKSGYSSWERSWSRDQLSAILQRYAKDAVSGGTYGGSVKRLSIESRSGCGRVRELRISSAGGTAILTGDRIRFALRQNSPGNPILPSTCFELASKDRHRITVRGSGYGHGVGMCQMGAIGRALSGQTCERILAAYYRGAAIRTVRLVTPPGP